MSFPPGFLLGAATSAFQIEGASKADGRKPSIWDTFSRVPGKIHGGDTADIACDHYHRLDNDLDLIESLGLNAYRFSIAWPRVLPEGGGTVNAKGLDFYRRLVDGLLAREIVPMATLYHWDLPQALQDTGGWRSRDTAARFAEYAAVVGAALRDEIQLWVTLNEPWCSAFVGHLEGRHAPGEQSLQGALEAAHHLLLAHGLASEALRSEGVAGEIGITLNLSDVHPGSPEPEDVAAAARIDGNENRWFLDPVLYGSYPEDIVAWYERRADLGPLRREDDLAVIAAPLDFLGVNYYEQHHVVADPDDPVHGARKLAPEPPVTGYGIAVRPEALTAILRRVAHDYTPLPLYITENGATYCDSIDPHGKVDDRERIVYLGQHLGAAHAALSEGIDLRGYFIWSLMDNFEWAEGYSRRFGLVYVDFDTQQRSPKASAAWYQALIASQSDLAQPEGVPAS